MRGVLIILILPHFLAPLSIPTSDVGIDRPDPDVEFADD
jgi:hypothetical protein